MNETNPFSKNSHTPAKATNQWPPLPVTVICNLPIRTPHSERPPARGRWRASPRTGSTPPPSHAATGPASSSAPRPPPPDSPPFPLSPPFPPSISCHGVRTPRRCQSQRRARRPRSQDTPKIILWCFFADLRRTFFNQKNHPAFHDHYNTLNYVPVIYGHCTVMYWPKAKLHVRKCSQINIEFGILIIESGDSFISP